MVGWVAGEEASKKRAWQGTSRRKLLLTFSISVWNILKAACLFEIAQSPATMDGGMGTSLGHICIQKTSC